MSNKVEQLQKDNECIKRRYDRAQKANNITEMYAARKDYQDNIEKQKNELRKMDKYSPEYRQTKDSIEKQQTQAYSMRYQSKTGNEMNEIKQHMKNLELENKTLSNEMDKAIQKGDTKKYDELNQRYSNNIKAQEGISNELKINGIQNDNTIMQQKVIKQNLDIDMRNKMAEKIQKVESKGKKPNTKDEANFKKYQQDVRNDERQALEEYDNKKLNDMESYGVSPEAINQEREKMEQARNRLLGENYNR